MFDKKSKKESDLTQPSFSPFYNIRKSLRRIKGKRIRRSANNLSNNECCKVTNVKHDSKHIDNKNLPQNSSFFHRKSKSKNIKSDNGEKVQFNIIEWSSCESINDLTKEKLRKHNSLRRSKASLLMPLSTEYNIPKKIIITSSSKISRYNSVDILNYTNLAVSQNKWCLSQSAIDPKNVQSNTLNVCLNQIDEDSKSKKSYKKRRHHVHSLSLPNIFENGSKKIVLPSNIEESDMELSEPIPVKERDDKLNTVLDRLSCDVEEEIPNSTECYESNNNNNKRYSLKLGTSSMYSSSISLSRPPIPSVPKPINKRDRHFKSASAEHLSSKQFLVNTIQFNGQALLVSKPFSDSHYQAMKKDFLEISCDTSKKREKEIIKDTKIECLATDQDNHSKEERKWRELLFRYQLPLAIAEAVFDHTSLQNDELTFSSGDVITVLFMEDESWWWGCAKFDKEGWFPASYVRLRVVQEIDNDENNEMHKSKSDISLCCSKPSKISLIGLQTKAFEKDKSMTVRAKCVEELLNTEIEYVKLLNNIIVGYLHKVCEDDLFTDEDAEVIFGNIEELYEFNKEFVEELKKCVKMEAMEESDVGEVFLKYKSRFEVYSNYCNNQPRSSARLSSLTKSKKIEFFMESCRLRQNMIRLSLDGFLLSPVQRICKYPLQLKELLKHTKPDHSDYNSLLNARSSMQNVASLINERKRRLENVNKLAKWQLSVTNWKDDDLVLKSSDLIYKGILHKVTSGKIVERHVYLFDHQLIYFKNESIKRSMLTYRSRINLDETVIEDIKDCEITTTRGDQLINAWKVWCDTKKKWYCFYASSKEEKEEWMKAFENERKHVRDENEKGFIVPHEVRLAAIENAYNTRIADLKRNRMRRKSIATYQIDTDALLPYSPDKSPERKFDGTDTSNVTKRAYKSWKNKTFRLSFQGTEKSASPPSK